MRYLEEKRSTVSTLIENQFPDFVQQNNPNFIEFLSSYYETFENKYQPLDIASNLIDYYNIGYYTPNQLIESTVTSSILYSTDTTIGVESTVGFPSTNGYIRIDDEIVFYRSKNDTQFLECVRGTSALVLENIPKSEVVLVNSNASEHYSNTIVENLSYNYALEFFNRIKSELAPLIPETVTGDLDFSQFLKNIKSFYSAKGSLNSHRILFKILFNDKKYSILLRPRGTGAKLKVNNYLGFIPQSPKPEIVSGGSGYDNRVDSTTNKLVNSPVIVVYGSGFGSVVTTGPKTGLRPNSTAVIEVTSINSNGTITDIEVTDTGSGYVGPIKTKIRPRQFQQDQVVYNSSGTGRGKVYYWDGYTNELVLYDVIGFFKADDEVIGVGGEDPRGFIARSFVGTSSIRPGVKTIPEEQNIEFPREYVFRTSDAKYSQKKIIKCKFLRGDLNTYDSLPSVLNIKQDPDILFGLDGVDIETDNKIPTINSSYEFEVSSNSDLDKLYVPPSTVITKNYTISTSNFVITVDDASRFPLTNGIVFIDGTLIEYTDRSFNQFFGCNFYSSETLTSLNYGNEVLSWGRKKINVEWQPNVSIESGEFRYYGDNLYKSVRSGTTDSTTGPTHTEGIARDGSFASGNLNPVEWEYIGKNTFRHVPYVRSTNSLPDTELHLFALVGDPILIDGGSLHTKQQYQFSNLNSPNTKIFNFTTEDISNRLAYILSGNFNRSYNTVTDSRLPSYQSLTGFNTIHDFDDYIYVPSSCIPPWWNEIVDLTQQNFNQNNPDYKKVAFVNQKLLTRYSKNSLIYSTRVLTNTYETKQGIGLNVDAIQVNSYKGNTINYGKIKNFVISNGGDYKVPIINSNGMFDINNYPQLVIDNGSSEILLSNSSKYFRISARFTSINFNKLAELWPETNLQFTSKPSIRILNNNPKKIRFIQSSAINTLTDTLQITYTDSTIIQFETSDLVKYTSSILGVIPSLSQNSEYYLRRISSTQSGSSETVTYSVHASKTDSILNKNKISLDYRNVGNFTILLDGEVFNPIGFREAEFDLSYNENTGFIDNIIIRDSGYGYVEAPSIQIVGGGLPDNTSITIPYFIGNEEIIEMRGNLISFTNYYNNSSYLIDTFTPPNTIFDTSPRVTVDSGSEAEIVAYTANGKVVSLVVVRGGRNYYTKPTVNVIGNGRDAVIDPIISNGEIVGFNIINQGSGYTTPPVIEIVSSGSGASISCNLNQWTFNLVHRLRQTNRIDSFGGYVYDESDLAPVENGNPTTSENPLNFTQIVPKDNLSPSKDNRQYLIIDSTDKLLAKYTIQQKGPYLQEQYPGTTFGYATQSEINQVLALNLHSPALFVSYDGVPVYGERGYSVRYDSTSPLVELKSRYKLKYSTTPTVNSSSITIGSTTYYVSRESGPSIQQYPIGSFIEDYEYIAGDENDLDEHNGRFCVTDEFPEGRYCYFATRNSYDDVTNQIVSQSGVNFGGFPYFIGNTFASEPDFYPNKLCRTNDRIPKSFTRMYEKELPPLEVDGVLSFPGFPKNDLYPSEDTSFDKTILRSDYLLPGSVDSVIIENSGDNYKIGDKLKVNNEFTFGSGFDGFVSKVLGKPVSGLQYNQISSNSYNVQIFTLESNGLSVGDYVYLDHESPIDPIEINLHNSTGIVSDKLTEGVGIVVPNTDESITQFDNKKFYSLNLNLRFKYKLNIPNLEYSITYDVEKNNEFFITGSVGTSSSTSIEFDASLIPPTIYLHIGDFIYEINVINEYIGEHIVRSIDTSLNSFTILIIEDPSNYEVTNLFYEAKSRGAIGPITEITVSNPGSNYRKLPGIEVESKTGSGALVQCDSSTIGRIKNINYLTSGGKFTSNLNVNYYVNIPATAKIINNFEIYEVEVINGGTDYNDLLTVLVNGRQDLVTLKVNVQIGVITSIEVIDGGCNFSEVPTIEIVSSTGSGVELDVKIRRKNLYTGESLTGNVNSQLYPVGIIGTVVNFDQTSSTLEYDELQGRFNENGLVYSSDGRKYGNIVRIRRSTAYSKSNSYIELESSRTDISGNTSDFLQKITDNNVYQDWSYILSSSRDTKEWRNSVLTNTHSAGHNLFGKKIIERRKFFFDNPEDVFKSTVIFTTNLVNEILLKVKLSPCKEQTISLINVSDYNVGEYIYGSTSESIAQIVEKNEYSLKLEIKNGKKFIIGEYIVKVPRQFAFGLESSTNRSLVFWNGLLQEPELSYESAFEYVDNIGNIIDPPIVGNLTPKFDISTSDEVLHYKLTSSFAILDSVTLSANQTLYSPSIDNESIPVSSDFLEHTIISLGGSVQNPDTFTVNTAERFIRFAEASNYESRLFAVSSPNINRLSITGSTSGTQFQLGYQPSSNCQLLIFYTGVGQSHLLTDYTVSGTTITFSETLDLNKIFGWYIDQTTVCSIVDVDYLNNNRITGTWNCQTKNFTQYIHSSASKNPSSLYELTKEYLDGTLHLDSDDTTVYGFDSRFTYTSPEYSTSYVEVLDKINFDGSTRSFQMTRVNGIPYTPVNGKDSLMVYIDNVVLDPDEYELSGQNIIFDSVYSSSQDCTIIDFNSSYVANQTTDKGSNLDRLDVQHDSSRTRFNLSDRGVPQYVKNVGDIFSIRNGVLQRPDARHQSLLNNKITFNEAPDFRDTTDLIYFNRQLLPLPTKNVVLDDFYCFDGIRTDFPLTLDGINYYPNNVYHVFVVRNGVYQKAGIDYRLATTSDQRCPQGLDCYSLDGSHIVFSEAPLETDEIIVFVSHDTLNSNFKIDPFRHFNGVETTFAITKNFVSHTPTTVDHIQVYRNGVYQYSGVDYTISSSNGGPRITFTTAPQETEEVYITEYNTSLYFTNITSNVTQTSTSTLTYSGTANTNDVFLIYKDGLLMTDGWSYNYGSNVFTFDEQFTLDAKTRVFLISNCVGQLDKFYKFDGIETTFPLTKNIVSKVPYSSSNIQVYRNGVYQAPEIDYTVSSTNGGPRITFTTVPLSTDSIFITNFDNTNFADVSSDFTQLNSTDLQYSGTLGSNYLLIFKDGVVQKNSSYSYNNITEVLSFTESIDITNSTVKIYKIDNNVRILDNFVLLDGVTDTFPLTYLGQSITSSTSERVQVYRNGVYQYPDIDYTIGSNAIGNKNIVFSTSPQTTNDDIFITEMSNSSNFEDLTGNFVQDNSTTLGNISSLDSSKTLLIYNQGILQRSDSYTYDYNNEKLIFDETFTLNLGVKIYAVSNSNGSLDSFFEFDGSTTTFPITYNNSSITPLSSHHVQVHRNGVYQTPEVDYTVSATNGGPRITFTTAPVQQDDFVITIFDSSNLTNVTPDVTQSSPTVLNYSGSIDLLTGLLLIYKNGILQIGNSYTLTSNTITFSESIDILSDVVVILHISNSYVNDSHKFLDGVETTFALTKNYTSISSNTAQNALVYRNGVHQYPGTDYTISTTNGGPRITFTTAPQSTENIFVQVFNTSTGFVDITSGFSSVNSTTFQYNSTLDVSALLVFLDGILQIGDSWIYDTTNQRLIFSNPVSGNIRVAQIKNCPVLINNLITEDTVYSYPLKNGRKSYYPTSTQSLFVCIDGIVQNPGVAYTVNGSNLEFLDENIHPGQRILVIDASAVNLMRLDRLETAWEVGSTKYFKLLNNYQSYTASNLLISQEGVVQDKSSYIITNSLLSLNDTTNADWNSIQIHNGSNSGLKYIDGIESIINENSSSVTYRLTKNYQTVSPSENSLIVSVEGIVQKPTEIYSLSGSLLTINITNSNQNTLEVIDVSGASLRLLDTLDDFVDQYVDSSGNIHNKYFLRNTYSETISHEDAFVSYGSIVQKPGVDYKIYIENSKKIFELITERQINLGELEVLEVSKSGYELLDNLDSFVSLSNGLYRIRLTDNYQTLTGLTDDETLVQINGVVQQVDSYNVIGSSIEISAENYEDVIVYDMSGSNLRIIDQINEDYNTLTFKLLQNYTSFTPAMVSDVFLLRDSVLQNPTEDYAVGTGYITFTSLINKTTDIFMKYVHTTVEVIPIAEIPYNICTTEDTYRLPYVLTETEKYNTILYLNGVPSFYGVDFNITGDILSFTGNRYVDEGSTLFAIKYSNIDYIDHLENCVDGSTVKFKLLYKGKNILALSSADILTNREGVIQRPGTDYTVDIGLVGGNSIAKWLTFATAPQNDNLFFVRMYQNTFRNLQSVGGSTTQYTSTTTINDPENVYVFANGNWMLPTKDYTYSNGVFTLQISSVDVFAIEFPGIVKLLDDVHTPYDSSRRLFNMFISEENFVPYGTIENDNLPHETSILIIKNGKVLDPGVDYTLNGDIKSQINFAVAPSFSDVIMVKALGSFKKLNTITTGFNSIQKTFLLKTNSTEDYYPNAEIERPREHENQILVIKDGDIQSPLYDYYIDNNKLVFNQSVPSSTSKIVVLDFRGVQDDVKVYSRFYQVKVGDILNINNIKDDERTYTDPNASNNQTPLPPYVDRKITEILSPTVIKTTSGTQPQNIFAGFSATATYADGIVNNITINSNNSGYSYPPVLRTKGSGRGAKAVSNIDVYGGGKIIDAEIQYPGYNVYASQEVVPTVYGFVYRNQQLSSSQIRRATTLSQNISSTVETFTVGNTTGLPQNPPSIQITSDTGSGATFRIYVSKQQIRKVEILTSGIGYDEITFDMKLIGGGGNGCVLEPTLDAFGSVTNVIIRNPGEGYDTFRVIVADNNVNSTSNVDAEFIEYTYVDGNTLRGCTRINGSSHSQGDYVYFDNYL